MNPRLATAAVTILALSLGLGVSSGARAATTTAHGVTFAERLEAAPGTPLVLCAAELLRYKVVFRGYVAALYLEDCERRDDVLADVPRRLELSYFWAIPGEKFGPAAREVLERSLGREELAGLEDRLETLHAAYRDVEPGDRYALTYVPGRGTELAWNGIPLVVVPGADFARAYFGIWLGDEPLDADLRDRLLESPALATSPLPPVESAGVRENEGTSRRGL